MFIGVISHHFNTSPSQPGAQLQKTIFVFLTAQNCELNARRNLWLEILEFCACSGYVAYTQGVDSVVE